MLLLQVTAEWPVLSLPTGSTGREGQCLEPCVGRPCPAPAPQACPVPRPCCWPCWAVGTNPTWPSVSALPEARAGQQLGGRPQHTGRDARSQDTRPPGPQPGGACECHGRTDKLAWAAARGRGGETGMHSRLWSDLPAPGRLMDTVPASTCTSPPHAGWCPPGNRTAVKTEVTIGVKLVVGALGASPHLRAACVTSLTPAPCHAVLSMFCR